MKSSTNEEFNLAAHLGQVYVIGSVDPVEVAADQIVLNPADDRTPFVGEGLNTLALLRRKHASSIPSELYPFIMRTAYSRSSKPDYALAISALQCGKARYDEGSFDRPPGAVLESRHKLATLMGVSGVDSLPVRFFGETEFSQRTAGELFDSTKVGSDFLSTFTQNFMELGMPFYRAAGIVRDDRGFRELLKERTRDGYRLIYTGKEWVSYHRYLDLVFAFAHSTAAERKALFASMVAAETVADINVTLGGRIRDNFYVGTGMYPEMSLRYAGELALLLVKHGIVRPLLESGTLEMTVGGRRLIELLPASCDDPDKYGHFHDFTLNPPGIHSSKADAVEAWLMEYFGALKKAGAEMTSSLDRMAD